MSSIPVLPLGQSGFRLQFGTLVVYIDPYLTDSVARFDGPEMTRRSPPPLATEAITDADYVFTTHAHRDHCDPDTILPLAAASPSVRVVAPPPAADELRKAGLDRNRLLPPSETWTRLDNDLAVKAVPAAHPAIERDGDGALRHVGYIFEYRSRRLYHSGDTSLTAELVEALAGSSPVDIAFLPVNEPNFMRAQRGILANMTIREAFHLAGLLGAGTLVPMHWDLFAPNSACREEIELLHRQLAPPFDLAIEPRDV